VLPLVDWVGLDSKTTDASYDALTTRNGSARNAWRSLELMLAA
jgi:pyruvate-formate lyase-activating enzyme